MAEHKQHTMLPVWLIVGDDALKQRVVLKRLNDRLAEYGNIEFNSETIDGAPSSGEKDAELGERIVDACLTLPFAGEKRLVTVTNANKLKKASSDAVAAYIEDPNDSTVLALVADELKATSKLYKAVAALGSRLGANPIIDCAIPKAKDMRGFIQEMASKTYGLSLTADAADTLLEYVGSDTVRIDNELNKLMLSHDRNAPVKREHIERSVARTAEAKPWDIVDAFSERDLARVLALYKTMPSASPLYLLANCVDRLRQLAGFRSLRSRGGFSDDALASELNIRPAWKVKYYDRYASNFSAAEIRDAIISSVAAEREMKSGADVDAAFIGWIVETLKR